MMESKAAAAEERVQGKVEAVTEEVKEEEATKIVQCDDISPARSYWATVKSQARSFGEYAVLRTRQGISMFGEPKLESLVKGPDAEAESR